MYNLSVILAVIILVIISGGLIIKRWTICARGFTQLGLFAIGEATLLCNRSVPCGNCPLSFGICPMGTIQRLAFIKTFPFYFTLILIGVIGVIGGSLTCGWVCPIGFMQDILHAPRINKFNIPNSLTKGRYLALFLFAALLFFELNFSTFSRRRVWIFNEYVIIGGVLFLLLSLVIKRPFCRIFCPVGLIYGKLNKISPIKVNLDKVKCSACGGCSKVCITDIKPPKEVNGDLCARCFSCKKVCVND